MEISTLMRKWYSVPSATTMTWRTIRPCSLVGGPWSRNWELNYSCSLLWPRAGPWLSWSQRFANWGEPSRPSSSLSSHVYGRLTLVLTGDIIIITIILLLLLLLPLLLLLLVYYYYYYYYCKEGDSTAPLPNSLFPELNCADRQIYFLLSDLKCF